MQAVAVTTEAFIRAATAEECKAKQSEMARGPAPEDIQEIICDEPVPESAVKRCRMMLDSATNLHQASALAANAAVARAQKELQRGIADVCGQASRERENARQPAAGTSDLFGAARADALRARLRRFDSASLVWARQISLSCMQTVYSCSCRNSYVHENRGERCGLG